MIDDIFEITKTNTTIFLSKNQWVYPLDIFANYTKFIILYSIPVEILIENRRYIHHKSVDSKTLY